MAGLGKIPVVGSGSNTVLQCKRIKAASIRSGQCGDRVLTRSGVTVRSYMLLAHLAELQLHKLMVAGSIPV